MDCPQCGTPLVTYRLAEREAPVCEQCGHVGIEAEHRPARVRVESWSEALRRFYGTGDAGEVTVPVRAGDEDESSRRRRAETWTEALERFYGGDSPAAEVDSPDDRSGESSESPDGDDDETRESSTPVSVPFEGTPAVRRDEAE